MGREGDAQEISGAGEAGGGLAERAARVQARLLRWGWPALEAEAMAERIARREGDDDRVTCAAECAHYRPGRCGNHWRAGLHSPELGRDLAGMLQRCAGLRSSTGG